MTSNQRSRRRLFALIPGYKIGWATLVLATFVLQFLCGLRVLTHPHDAGTVRSIAVRPD